MLHLDNKLYGHPILDVIDHPPEMREKVMEEKLEWKRKADLTDGAKNYFSFAKMAMQTEY